MISWTRCVLGQTQEGVEPLTDLEPSAQEWREESLEQPVDKPQPEGIPLSLQWGVIGCSLLVAGAAVMLLTRQWGRAERLEQELVLAQDQIGRLEAQNGELSQRLTALRSERDALDEQVFTLSVRLSSAAEELEQARVRLEDAQDLSKQLGEARAELHVQKLHANAARAAAEQEVSRLGKEKSQMARSVERLRYRLVLLERDYREMAGQLAAAQSAPHPALNVVSSTPPSPVRHAEAPISAPRADVPARVGLHTVELAPVVVRRTQQGIAVPLSARLVEVNPLQQFIVIDRGRLDGVREGMVFDVIRGTAAVGQALAASVRPQLAACDITQPSTAQAFRVGDLAIQRLE